MISPLQKKFLDKRSRELAARFDSATSVEAFSEVFRATVKLIADKKCNLSALEGKLEYYSRFDSSVIVYAESEGRIDRIEPIAGEHLRGFMLNQILPGAVEIARQEVADCEEAFAKFKADNFQALKKLGLG